MTTPTIIRMRPLAAQVLCACLAAGAGAASAQSGAAEDLPRVVIHGDAPDAALTAPDAARARQDIARTPGAVDVVPDTAFKNGRAQTIKDVLERVPGVVVQTRWGPDARVSVRGSGMSRNYGNRGINVYMDGIPINTSDGLFDLFEIDPTAYRYVEVFKGANAMRYGANSLGGAINFVTPTGRDVPQFDARFDAASFGYLRVQAATGGADGAVDHFLTVSSERWDGYRDHSKGHQTRVSGNLGYRLSADAETRFYINANTWRSRLPGEVSKDAALNNPRAADGFFELVDQQRNIDSYRLANKTTLRFDATQLDVGVFGTRRHVMHPIYQWLDFRVRDHGGFARLTDDQVRGGHRNRFIAGINIHDGKIDNEQYLNLPGAVKGALAASNVDKSENQSAYFENSWFATPSVALVVGTQYLHATRVRSDRFLSNGDQSGENSFALWSPKVGVVWDVDPAWQVFANVSRSAEVPSFDVNTYGAPASSTVQAQTATTFEVGTRGQRGDLRWDVALYRANVRNELQCLTNPAAPGACTVRNADRTVHQGLEAGVELALAESAWTQGDAVILNATYSYNDFRFDGDARYGDNRLPGVPPHALRAELLYRHRSGLQAGPAIEWMPRAFFSDNANQLAADSYALLNFKLGYDAPGSRWSGYLEGRNLLDKRYISSTVVVETATPTSALFNPGTGRSVHAGVRYKW